MIIAYNGAMRLATVAIVGVLAACSASTRELPADMFSMPPGSGPLVVAGLDAGAAADAGPPKGSALASARKKKDVVEDTTTTCTAHARQTAANEYVVPQAMWSALRNEVYRSNLFSPHLDANQVVDGYTLNGVGPCFAEMGLTDYDLLRSVNGIDFTGSDAYMRIWESIQQQGTAVLHLERAGIIVELHYKVQL